MDVIEEFWGKIRKSLENKTKNGWNKGQYCDIHCIEWVGSIDRDGYGVKRVTWPDKSCFLEKAHRVAFMYHNKLLHHEVPRLNNQGLELDVSHRCHNKVCINPLHLVLETHSANVSRGYCVTAGVCVGGHCPACLFPRKN